MALAGLHVVCGYAGGLGFRGIPRALFADIAWSQTMALAGTTTLPAPDVSGPGGRPVFRIRTQADAWCSIGATPDASVSASTGKRFLVPAGVDYDIFASPGDKLAWLAA